MHGHNLAAMIALGALCRDRRMLCIHFHHRGVKSELAWKLIYRVAVEMFPVITFPTSFIRDEAVDIYPPLQKVSHVAPTPFVVPPATVTECGRRLARATLGLPEDSFIVGNAGWLIPRKRWDVFLSVAACVVKRLPHAHFAIAGDGPCRDRLEAQAQGLGIADRITWLGWIQNMQQFYSALDVLLFNSDWDALGRTPVEAVALGTPVVASVIHGGLSEVLRPGVDAFVLDSHDVDQLCSHVLDLTDRALASRMAQTARVRLAADFSPQSDADEMCRLLQIPSESIPARQTVS